ncbi:MAG: MATE family efflux transporter [Butyricicoccus sp.]
MKRIRLSDHFTYRTLLTFTLPCIIMMIVTSIYSIVDGYFVSNFAGKNAFAAVNLIMPVLMALGSFGFMIGTGGSALVAKTLGEGKMDKANELFTMLVSVIIAVGAALTVFGFLFMPDIARLLGASDRIIDDCVLYGRILILSDIFFMLQNGYQSFLVTAEKPKFGLCIAVIAGVLNMVLDFLLVYVFRLGITGAAVATVISQLVGGIVPTIYFARENSSLLRLVRFRMDWHALVKACTNGSSEMLTNLSTSLVSVLYNFQLMKSAAENGVAAYGVIMYVNFVFMAFFFGYAVGTGPVVGYHFGAQDRQELKSLLRKSLVITTVAALAMTAAAELAAMPLARLFVGYDAELCRITVTGLKLYSLSFLLCGYNIFGSAYFTGLNNGKASALISILRTLVLQVIAIFVLPLLLGINGIWLAIVAAEGATLLVTASLFVRTRHAVFGAPRTIHVDKSSRLPLQ